MKISVLGCGRWGSFLAYYHGQNHEVFLYGREQSSAYAALRETHKNEYLTLPSSVALTSSLKAALQFSDVIIISIGAQHLRNLMEEINSYDIGGKTFILCMKGIEADTGMRLSEVVAEVLRQQYKLAVWVGPGHVQDFVAGIPNCMVIDSADAGTIDYIVDNLNSDLIRLYKGNDLIGTEIGAAAKNVVGIAAGMLDGKGISSLKGALMARGAREVARLIKAMGGSELSAYGLCHLGDYEATLFSEYSHNRRFGESYIKGENYMALAEGVPTSKAIVKLSREFHVEMPICETVYSILYENKNADLSLKELFSRSVKNEFGF
ncbi:MAG: NAD(P)H-dependent glycerol-3-phosphate dehydrogenase [Oscillospiraceae bacterium]